MADRQALDRVGNLSIGQMRRIEIARRCFAPSTAPLASFCLTEGGRTGRFSTFRVLGRRRPEYYSILVRQASRMDEGIWGVLWADASHRRGPWGGGRKDVVCAA